VSTRRGRVRLEGALQELLERSAEFHGQARRYAEVVALDPITVELHGSGIELTDGEELVLDQDLRRYDEEVGVEEGDTLVVTPMPDGKFLADALIGESDDVGALSASLPPGNANRIVRGRIVGSTGAVAAVGTGDWSVVRNSAGVYTITFDPAFGGEPTVTCTFTAPPTAAAVFQADVPAAGSVVVRVLDGAAAALDSNFSFMAVGA